ncbi:hypothetical protein [uncultured Gilliamella sp.]|uniref:hypothetical protein n=1 Tax=uncultured Gilliamella sp. TaxID=1193505 RepID=UPI0025F1684B|nr:hypothetical protein [uncultured Gilliamella sp.]
MKKKHYLGKHLLCNIIHGEYKLQVLVVHGYSSEHVPEVKFIKQDVSLSAPKTTNEFDKNLQEMLSDVKDDTDLVFLCSQEKVFEYAYSKIKDLSNQMKA